MVHYPAHVPIKKGSAVNFEKPRKDPPTKKPKKAKAGPLFFVFTTTAQQEKAGSAKRTPALPAKSLPLKSLDMGEGRGLWDPNDQEDARDLEIGASTSVIWGTSQGGMRVTIIRVE